MIQASLLAALQPQPAAAVTVTAPVVAAVATFTDVGEIDELHGTPACVTVNVLPSIVSVPLRGVDAAVAATM